MQVNDRKRYMITADPTVGKGEADAFTQFLADTKGVAFWHYIALVWFVTDYRDGAALDYWRDQCRHFLGRNAFVVAEIAEGAHWVVATKRNTASDKWFKQHFGASPMPVLNPPDLGG